MAGSPIPDRSWAPVTFPDYVPTVGHLLQRLETIVPELAQV